MIQAEAFAPGHITGFFKIQEEEGDPLLKGSLGAGVSTSLGVTTKLEIERSPKTLVEIKINGKPSEAVVSTRVVSIFLERIGESRRVLIEHEAKVPIGCGFGSSGAGALSLAYALNEALNLNLPKVEAAQVAHIAEVSCGTGLGAVIAEVHGGVEVRVNAGAPGIGQVKPIPVDKHYLVACLSFGPMSTKDVLTDPIACLRINAAGGKLVDELLAHPSVERLMALSRGFAEEVGLISERVRRVLGEAGKRGFTLSMMMIGDGVFTIVPADAMDQLLEIFNSYASQAGSVIISEIDFKGARVLS